MKVADLTNESRYALRPLTKNSRYELRSVCRPTKSMRRPAMKFNPKNSSTNGVKHIYRRLQTVQLGTLNDNCILYVMDHLPLADLCNTAEVSKRLNELAQLSFRLKYRNLDMKLLATKDTKITTEQTRSLFRNFGALITSLHVSRKDFEFDQPAQNPFKGLKTLLRLIYKHCNSLQSLTIGHFWMNMKTVRDSVPIFKRLTTLNFYRVSCYCPEDKTFHHFGNVLPLIMQSKGLTRQTPQIVQLI